MRLFETWQIHRATAMLAVTTMVWILPTTVEAQARITTGGDAPSIIAGQSQTNWESNNLDQYNQRFSELDQIDTTNVGQLERLWTFDVPSTINVRQVTPLVVDGVMYLHGRDSVLALNAVTGESVWTTEVEGMTGGTVRGRLHVDGRIDSGHGDQLGAPEAATDNDHGQAL